MCDSVPPLAVVSPAPLLEMMELARPEGLASGLLVKTLIVQHCRSETFGLVEPGRGFVAVCGLYPLPAERPGEQLYEAWFVCGPGMARHLLRLVRLARLTVRREALNGAVRLRAFVRAGHRPGRRLAAAMGFVEVAQSEALEIWELEGPTDERCRPGREEPVRRRRRRGAPRRAAGEAVA